MILLISCRNESSRSLQTGKDYILITSNISSVMPLIIHSSLNSSQVKANLTDQFDTNNTCALFQYISGDTTSMIGPIVYDIDFQHGCSDSDGVHKAGLIHCSLDEYLASVNGTCSVDFDGLQIGGDFLWGGLDIVTYNLNSWKIITRNLRLQSGKKNIILEDTLIFNKIVGQSTSNLILDDDFLISTNGHLIDRNNVIGNGYSDNIYKMTYCRWLSQGIIEIDLSDGINQIINFGDNECDNQAMFELGENQYVVEMQ